MKKLLKMYKSLPREVKMMLAMAGLASPIGAIYFLRRFFPNTSTFTLIMIVGGIVLGVCLIGFLVTKLFGRGSKKRSRNMESELTAGGGEGPVGVDVRAQIKANNDKFLSAVGELKKAFDTSVYDLPWYIVIGDSGCGKTTMINNGGLVFPGGKPEGYQLGTLNYNWWFTQDAVFIDMAGRLINPQEDADHREWQGFLDTVARGRKGFPINGCIVCISAEHLLADSPQKHEADANTVLERLRDLQKTLGVTFATYLIITKCDKILGFMQLFDRADRDIRVKKQMVGWSKAGRFDELYDPEAFEADFDSLYARFNELRLRRLNDEADKIDLGFAYSFPEEFRELRAPLQTYLRTLFPPIKNPRGIKNLIFRGVYFTSATQEGEVILKHMRERLGSEAAEQLPSLQSLYPEPTPLFVKDLLFRKIFPENGLVFRHARDVEKNRKLGKLLKWGSAAMAIVLIGVVGWSAITLDKLMGVPRTNAKKAADKWGEPIAALKHCEQLGKDIDALKQNRVPVYLLSMSFGADRPVNDLTTIRTRVFEEGVLRNAFHQVDEALRAGPRGLRESGLDEGTAAQKYMDALVEYVTWLGCRDSEFRPGRLNYESFKTLCDVVTDPRSLIVGEHRETFVTEAKDYFSALDRNERWKNPAGLLTEGRDSDNTVRMAVGHVHRYMKDTYAELGEHSPDQTIAEWMRILGKCQVVETRYSNMVEDDPGSLDTTDKVEEFTRLFEDSHGKFAQAMGQIKWTLGAGDRFDKINYIREAILAQRDKWLTYDRTLYDAYRSCELRSEKDARRLIPSLQFGSESARLVGLDTLLWGRLYSLGLTEQEKYTEGSGYYDEGRFEKLVHEVDKAYAHIIKLERGSDAGGGQTGDNLGLSADAGHVQQVLDWVNEQLASSSSLSSGASRGGTVAEWLTGFEDLRAKMEADPEGPPVRPDLDQKWEREKLVSLSEKIVEVVRRADGAGLLERIEARLAPGEMGEWGFAELAEDWHTSMQSEYSIPIPRKFAQPEGFQPPKEDKRVRPPKLGGRKRPALGGKARRGTTPVVQKSRARRGRRNEIPACADPGYLGQRAREGLSLLWELQYLRTGDYLSRADESTPLHERCYRAVADAWGAYADKYAGEWHAAYESKSLDKLSELNKWDEGWYQFAYQFSSKSGGRRTAEWRDVIEDEFRPALEEILRATVWATYDMEIGGPWEDLDPDGSFRDPIREVASAVRGAIEGQWGPDSFVVKAVAREGRSSGSLHPWEALTDDFCDVWQNLVIAIGNSHDLRARAEKVARQGPELGTRGSGIDKWGGIPRIRRESRLDDEVLTGRLVEFETRAQGLLDHELTGILCEVQATHFPQKHPPDGWPYLATAGSRKSLDTVGFKKFKHFLAAVQRTEVLLGRYDKDLPATDMKDARSQFYEGCRAWFGFLDLEGDSDDVLVASPLSMKVKGGDSKGDPVFERFAHDTAQLDYKFWDLKLGLQIDEGTQGSSGNTLRIPTRVDDGKFDRRGAVWEWEKAGSGDTEVSVQLVQPISGAPKDGGKSQLGRVSPLALCAYLYGYGYGEGKTWQTFNLFEVKNAARGVPLSLGEMLVFTLDRPMPAPIKKLRGGRENNR